MKTKEFMLFAMLHIPLHIHLSRAYQKRSRKANVNMLAKLLLLVFSTLSHRESDALQPVCVWKSADNTTANVHLLLAWSSLFSYSCVSYFVALLLVVVCANVIHKVVNEKLY